MAAKAAAEYSLKPATGEMMTMQPTQPRFGRRTMLAMSAAGVALAGRARAADDRMVLYSANDDTVNKIVAEGFKQASGITVDVVSTGSGVLFRRLNSEA